MSHREIYIKELNYKTNSPVIVDPVVTPVWRVTGGRETLNFDQYHKMCYYHLV